MAGHTRPSRNEAPTSPMCAHFEALKKFIVETSGFEFVEEGLKKKKGYAGLKPGDFVTFGIDTYRNFNLDDKRSKNITSSVINATAAPTILVQLGHLRS
ncbi:hypothetical protein CEUSTIGMA_g10779.t1 [Chlamydomonas eustigma]|uniref:Uncharacterized protein n=1 Tax=Chlamydomonas eustigma TaxID=1157962 RepID=A0A250XJU8_9CHLO|nr:hypothetical protein CEUSTIGMA_g10779.t1 [Chlamydomonas eustigma]|eukprot:GAX83354.1 hypothetical protein CEUSTIGMA_g10779.t1 [Chlamydomonas eustigma]